LRRVIANLLGCIELVDHPLAHQHAGLDAASLGDVA